MSTSTSAGLALLGMWSFHTHASIVDSSDNITQWYWPSSIVAYGYLYITGGEQYSADGVMVTHDSSTYTVDLSLSWDAQTITSVSSTSNPSNMTQSRQPSLFFNPSANTINRYGGWPYDGVDYPSTVWSFPAGASTPNWTQGANASINGLSAASPGPFAAAVAYSNTTFFSLGGNFLPGNSGPDMTVLPGLCMQDFATQTWTNVSTRIDGEPRFRTEARAAFVPNFGAKGIFVAVGGESPSTDVSIYEGGNRMVNMTLITLYDVASGTLYEQTATGDQGNIPPPRSEFCAVGAPSLDGHSFEIFIYGGSVNQNTDAYPANANSTGYLNVYVLSIPAFRWFQSNSSTPIRRAAHTCSVIGNRQMISVGGHFPSSLSNYGIDEDPWPNQIGIFDMTDLVWRQDYYANALPYDSPSVVKGYYTSNYVEPTWTDPSLASMFTYPVATSAASQSSSGTPVGAIAGGVAGGVVAVGCLVGLGVFLFRQRQNRKRVTAKSKWPPHQGAESRTERPSRVDGELYEVGSSNSPELAEMSTDRSYIPELGSTKSPELAEMPTDRAYVPELPDCVAELSGSPLRSELR